MHSTILAPSPLFTSPGVLDADVLRRLCLEAGADDVGFVELSRPALASERPHIERAFPHARSLISFVLRMNRDNVRSPARSVANAEFHHTNDDSSHVARRIVAALEAAGVRALNPAAGFPMEADRWMSERLWVIAHKPVAEAAGMGRMGIHRNVIHPRFGNFILLGTILVGAEVSAYSRELDYNPCLECKLCVAACPVGAIGSDGSFAFQACMTHNYREFMGGFLDWTHALVESGSTRDYHQRINEAETVSFWQSLSFGPNYKAAYCMAVCPAGEDVIGPYLQSKKAFADDVMRPLQAKKEPIYVIPGSDAEAHVARRFPHKTVRHVRNTVHPRSIGALLVGLPVGFQRHRAGDLDATYHFTFTGAENAEATVRIADGKIAVERGLHGAPNLKIVADTATWLGFVAKERNLPWALLTRRIRLKGNPRWLLAFGRCFV